MHQWRDASSRQDVEEAVSGGRSRGAAATNAPRSEHSERDSLLGNVGAQPLPEFLHKLQKNFGFRLLVLLSVVQHGLKGFGDSFVGQATPYIFKAYHVSGPLVQIYTGVARLPWSMKPIMGLCSDVLPVCGYKKAPYMLGASVLGFLACLCIGLVPQESLPVTSFVMCLFCVNLQGSACDLLSEAKYAERIQEVPSQGPALLTFVWFGLTVGGIFAVLGGGTVIGYFGAKANFVIAAVPAAAVVFPVASGYLEEQRLDERAIGKVREHYYQQKEACALVFLSLACQLSIMVCGLVQRDPFMNCVVSVSAGLVLVIAFTVVLSPVIAKFAVFSLVQTSLSLSVSGASFYFYTDSAKSYPEGPNLSPFFYNTIIGTLGALFSLAGIAFYQRYMSTWRYRFLLIFTNCVLSILSVVDVIMFARINVRYDIPDRALLLGMSVFEPIIAQWQYMPQVVIFSYLCPKDMEATMYAILAAAHNLGLIISGNGGALLLHNLGCTPTGEDGETAQFENLWIASAICTILPFLSLFVLYRLVPDVRQTEAVIDPAADATTGSLWRRWTRGHD